MEKRELVIVTWKSVDPRKNYTLYHYISFEITGLKYYKAFQ